MVVKVRLVTKCSVSWEVYLGILEDSSVDFTHMIGRGEHIVLYLGLLEPLVEGTCSSEVLGSL